MARIETYINDNTITDNDIVLGSDGDNGNKTKNYTISGLVDYFGENIEGNLNQDNVFKNLYLGFASGGNHATITANAINASTQFTVSQTQIYFFNIVIDNFFYVYSFRDIGKGTYGVEGTQINSTNLQVISRRSLNTQTITDETSTDTFALGNLGALPIEDGVNGLNPAVNIQPLSEGFTVFTATINGEDLTYLFTGESGLTGSGEQQVTSDDFELLSNVDASSQFTEQQAQDLLALIYLDGTTTLSVSPNTFEKNLTSGVTVQFDWSIVSNDDTINSATFDGTDVTVNLIDNESFTSVKDSLSKTLSVQFLSTLDDTTTNVNTTKTSTALTPQWKGSNVSNSSFNGESYVNLNSSLTKFLQSSTSSSITVPAGEYGIFLSTGAGLDIIEEGTGFALSPSAYTETSITVEFQDGTSLPLTEYIIDTATSEFTYNLQ